MKILIIGNSPHLSEAIHGAYPDHEIKILPWRSHFDEMTMTLYDLIFVVGFDYGSYTKRYEDYLNINVMQPLSTLQRFAKPATDIVYVATQNELTNCTFSRYRFAKEKLGYLLVNQFANSYVIRFDTFTSSSNEPLVKGGTFSKLVFSSLVKLGVVKTVDMRTVAENLKTYKTACSDNVRDVKGIFMSVPRPQFFDRLVRLSIG